MIQYYYLVSTKTTCILRLYFVILYSVQDTLPSLGFKTYYVRAVANESAAVGCEKVTTTLSTTKNIPQDIDDDFLLENEVVHIYYQCLYILQYLV